ncbi:unnamed protein product, partial [Brassica napus]
IFLFLFSLCIIVHVHGHGVKISNELKFQKDLNMSCFSADDRIKERTLKPGTHWEFNFGLNVVGNTRYMCTLKQGPGFKHHQSFRAFKRRGLWDWRAREDGIYLTRKKSEQPHKEYDWLY